MQIISKIFASDAAVLAALKAASPLLVSTDKEGVDHVVACGLDANGARFDVVLTPLSTPGVGTIPGPKMPDGSDGPPLPAPATLTGEVQVDVYWQGPDVPTLAGGRAAQGPASSFDPPRPSPAVFDADAVSAECKRRIFAIASTNAQVNMAAARAAGILSSEDEAAFLVGLQWIAAMRAACAGLIAAQDATFAADAHWPPCPAEVVALAAKF